VRWALGKVGVSKKAEIKVQGVMRELVGGQWVREQCSYTWLQRLAMSVLGVGQVPRHIAFIMDGNRRFARVRGEETIEGHKGGFHKLAEALQWCRELGVKEVTVYAFSIENFRRSEEEVNALLQLAKEKFEALVKEADQLAKHGVRVRVLGNTSLLPADVLAATTRAEEVTRNNSECTLNVALAYTSREEMTRATRKLAEAAKSGHLKESEVTVEKLEANLYTAPSPPVDLMIRTSGEKRLSDFLLWQADNAVIHFTSVLWPEFSLWHLLAAIFYYQRHRIALNNVLESNYIKEEVDQVSEPWKKLSSKTD